MIDVRELQKKVQSNDATLIAVSKTHSVEEIRSVYDQGIRHFGENKVQEMVDKQPQLPDDIFWHLIGHLQTNKVKYIAPFVHLIHTVDSIKLLNEIEKQAARCGREIRVLFQFHIAMEESKSGIQPDEMSWISGLDFQKNYSHVLPCGVMGMATFTNDETQIRTEFRTLTALFNTLKKQVFPTMDCFTEISMGMSSDYPIALEEGATLVRIGSLIFGARSHLVQ